MVEKAQTEGLSKRLSYVIVDGVMSHLLGVLTGGVFLVAIALKLGASNSQIGLLAAIPPLTQFVQIPAIFIINKLKSRKIVAVYSALIGRLGFLFIALSPLLFSSSSGLLILFIAIFFNSALGGIGGCAWNSWMRDLIPEDKMGSFFSKRLRSAIILGIFVSFLASIFIDYWRNIFPQGEIYSYSILFFIGFVFGLVGVTYLWRVPETEITPEKTGFVKVLSQPFRDINFRRLMLALGSWSFAVNLAAPFFTVYMLTRLGYGMTLIVLLSIISQFFNFTFLGLWGKWADRFSNKSVLAVSGPLFMFTILGWTFTTMPEVHFLTFPLIIILHAVMGIATAGVTIASGNISLKLAPKGQATAYLAVNALINSFAAGLAPVLGGLSADFFASQNLSLLIRWAGKDKEFVFNAVNLSHWDFFFGLAFFIGLYALHRIAMVTEQGQVDEQAVKAEFMEVIKRPVRSLSSGAGLFQIISYPYFFAAKGIDYFKKIPQK